MEKYGAIDIGTNSIKFFVAEKDESGKWKNILDFSEITRLGEGLEQTGKINENAIERNLAAVEKMLLTARKENVQEVIAVGTMALRTATNAKKFIDRVAAKCDVLIEILSGEEEARLSYLAVKSGIGLSENRMLIFDTGGGSTEFIVGSGDMIEKQFSLNVGSVRFTEQILKSDPVTDAELKKAVSAIEKDLRELKFEDKLDVLVGMGGTMTNLGAIHHKLMVYDSSVIQGTKLKRASIDQFVDLFKSKTIKQRSEIVGLQPKRADVILAGTLIVCSIMKKAEMDSVTISDRSLRHGLIVDRFGE